MLAGDPGAEGMEGALLGGGGVSCVMFNQGCQHAAPKLSLKTCISVDSLTH